MGPTASGKTLWHVNCMSVEILNWFLSIQAWSIRIWILGRRNRLKKEQQQYPHHLIVYYYTIGSVLGGPVCWRCLPLDWRYARTGARHQFWSAEPCCISSRCQGLADNLPNADQAIRDTIIAKAEQESWQAVYDELVAVDPIAGQKFRFQIGNHIIRALEVYRITGEPITRLQAEQPKNQPYRYNFYNYALMPDRLELHQHRWAKIEQDVEYWFFKWSRIN